MRKPVFSAYCYQFLFGWYDSLRPSQQFISYVGMGLPATSTKQRVKCLAQGQNAASPVGLKPLDLQTSTLPLSHHPPIAISNDSNGPAQLQRLAVILKV